MTTTVIYVAYQTPVELLQRSIESVERAARIANEEIEVLVVDNGGADGYGDDLRTSRIIGDGVNGGFGRAVNSAVRVATGQNVLLMNPDSRAHPDLLRHLRKAQDCSEPGTLFGALLLKAGNPQIHAYNMWWSSIGLLLKKKRWRANIDRAILQGSVVSTARLCGAGLYGDIETLRSLGPFDESFFLYGEDVDLSLRAKEAGADLKLVPKAVIDHDAGSSSEGASALVERARTDAHLRLLATYKGYVPSMLARFESLLVTLLGALLVRDATVRKARLARLQELRRWGATAVAEPFRPDFP